MRDQLDPTAVPFRPLGNNAPRHPPPPPPPPPSGLPFMPPHALAGLSQWNPFDGPPPRPPPPPPPFFTGNHSYYSNYPPHEHAPPDFGPPWPQRQPANFHAQNPAYGQPPFVPHHAHQQRQQYPHPHQLPYRPAFAHPPPPAASHQARLPPGAANEDFQVPVQSSKKSKKTKAKAKAKAQTATNDLETQDAPQPASKSKKGRYGDEKIMLPAPQPTDLYLAQAFGPPSRASSPGHILIILDLNGTVLYRPNKNTKTMIARPYLEPFLRHLFQNFKVMVWSSAKPVNVKALVEQALAKDLRSKLVATWARDTFGLSATNYNQNVQVYKNLRLVWSRDQIQQHHPQYSAGERFGQHNTVLIDDSSLKASAQPHNLLEIPEFEATPEQMQGDVLCEVAGYLEKIRRQTDVSRFIKAEPFTDDGRWKYEWPVEVAECDLKTKVAKESNKGRRTKHPSAAHVNKVANDLSSKSLATHPIREAVKVGS